MEISPYMAAGILVGGIAEVGLLALCYRTILHDRLGRWQQAKRREPGRLEMLAIKSKSFASAAVGVIGLEAAMAGYFV